MGKRNKYGRINEVLGKRDRCREFVYYSAVILGMLLLCFDGWRACLGAGLYICGFLYLWLCTYRSEKITLLDHNEYICLLLADIVWVKGRKRHNVIDNGQLLLVVLVLSLILGALFVWTESRKKRFSVGKLVTRALTGLFIISAFYVIPFVLQANVQLDYQAQTVYQAVVMSTEVRENTRSIEYYANVSYQDATGQPAQASVAIAGRVYQKMEVQQQVRLVEGSGFFGADYMLIETE